MRDSCKEYNVDLAIYISLAYDFIKKYSTPGHKIPISYLLNDKVVSYCLERASTTVTQSMYTNLWIEEIVKTERQLKSISTQETYKNVLLEKTPHLSDAYIIYKTYVNNSYLASFEQDVQEELKKFHSIFQPIFTYILAKNNVYYIPPSFSWTHSKFDEYSSCPILFRDHYILGLLPSSATKNAANILGNKVHDLFEEIVIRYKKSKTKNLVKLLENIQKTQLYKQINEEAPEHLSMLSSFFLQDFQKLAAGADEIYTEETLSAVIGSVKISGILDLLIISGNTAIIIDYKTSKIDNPTYYKKNTAKYTAQLSLYGALLQKVKPEITDVSLCVVYTRGKIESQLKFDGSVLSSRIEETNSIKSAYRLGNYSPNTRHCFLCTHPNCPHRSVQSMWNTDGTRRK